MTALQVLQGFPANKNIWCPVRAWLFFTFLPTYLFGIAKNLSQNLSLTKRKSEGPQQQHFAFPEISKQSSEVFGAPFWKLASFPESESWLVWGKI